MNASKNQVVNAVASQGIVFEALEGRQMMSASHHHHHAAAAPKVAPKPAPAPAPAPVVINNAALTITTTGGVLTVVGTTGNDQITISQSGNVFTIQNGNWKTTLTGSFTSLLVKGNNGNDRITIDPSVTENATIYGGTGNDTLIGNNANDTFYAGGGINTLKGGSGVDTFVTIGSTSDTITSGGNTADSFWINAVDALSGATIAGNVHRVSSFLGGVSTTLSGQTLAEPATTDKTMVYKNFSNLPLFNANGPAEDDVVQGYVGDCWYLSSLASVAKVDAGKIVQSVVSLGDGTYAVQFTRNGQNVFARVDANLPTWYSQDAYANTVSKNGNSLWVAIMEKAMTQFMGTTASYSNIDGGWMSTAYDSMGIAETNIWSAASAADLANQLASNLAANKAVTMAIGNVPAGAPLIGSHAYTVDHVTKDAKGNVVSITLRNPWGIDGAGNDGSDDGYVTITAAQAFAGYLGVTVANA